MKKKVAVMFGGKSPEHEISILTAMQALSFLDKEKYDIFPVYIEQGFFVENVDSLESFLPFEKSKHKEVILQKGMFFDAQKTMKKVFKPDVVLLCTHGANGENGVLQGLLEENNLPYTSTDVKTSAIGMDKEFSKIIFESLLYNVVKFQTIFKKDFFADKQKTMKELEEIIGFPMIVKPSSLGSSIGIKVVENTPELDIALQVASKFDEKIIVEKAISDFVEINCACVRKNNEILISETESPVTWNKFLTFEDKYMENMKMSGRECQIPAKIEPYLEFEIKQTVKDIYQKLDLCGVVRFDFLFDNETKKLYINEMNTIPGSLSFYLFNAVGIENADLLDIMIDTAIFRFDEKSQNLCEFRTEVLKNYGKRVLKK